ncbi:Fusaric acid resistance protein-like-domain-containing protein [Mycotypha africana]|uniref:Fusaric acid resistance protein-like-domain-containing protein n=1 Tax=Mycotypha africana TaxID=64632 RepID=UPI0022FFDE01|nr:Fusaric acid resistance protein-like-domain-containing protein [Mycotypha africana]KAI8973359.1 Fusaric acid resistance protein-like-domain-containing protein [Mycotypha africana]
MYLANLARNPADRNPVQPGACAILAVFLFVGTFAINLVRMKTHKANFACVIACIILTFTMTYAAGYPIFVPQIAWLFLRPVALAGAISLAVNYFIWPDDSINNFLGIARKTLAGYNAFLKEHSDAFLSASPSASNASLPTLNARLKNGVLLLIDCKRAVKRELIYSRISDVDCSELTRAIIGMRSYLHGIGLSLILKNDYAYAETKDIYFEKFNDPQILDAFYISIEGIRTVAAELSSMCYRATDEASVRLGALHYHPRTALNSLLWPFPRLYVSKSKSVTDEASAQTANIRAAQLRESIRHFDEVSQSDAAFYKFLSMNAADIPRNGPLYLIFLYIYNLKNHALHTAKLLELIETIETKRLKPRFWLPHQTLKRWIAGSSNVGGSIGGDEGDYRNNGDNDLGRISTRVNIAHVSEEDDDLFDTKRTAAAKKSQIADPDVSAPATLIQKFFYYLYLIGKWFTDTTTFFAFKTAVGVVMLAIPAWRPQDQGWYTEWRGQWAMITLVLWMFPMTGAFVFGLFDRVLGSIIGSILGIVVWEICRGNPYGMAVVCFIVFLPLYHVFFFIPKYRVASLMSTVTMLLVLIYEYGYVVEGLTNYDQVYTVAGKRLLLVLIGIAASGILMAIPFPPTGRVELRKKIAKTVRDIGRCYGILSASIVSPSGQKASPGTSATFMHLALGLRRQVAAERALLHDANYEPPLRGYFPAAKYKTLVEKMDNMSDLVANMVKLN